MFTTTSVYEPPGRRFGTRSADTTTVTAPSPGAATGWDTPPCVPEDYRLLGKVGRGGMGVVYTAWWVSAGRVVALKVSRAGALTGAEDRARFRAEAEALARLRHPHIIRVFDAGERDGCPYLALEFMDGGSLRQRLARGPLPPRQAARLIETLARAVHHMHRRGIVHRDLKPGNILLQKNLTGGNAGSQGGGPKGARPHSVSAGLSSFLLFPSVPSLIPKIADLGLAKGLVGESGPGTDDAILGTPSYMSPEQASGKTRVTGPATDIWALGAMFYELLTGRPPFRAATSSETLELVRSGAPAPLSRLRPGLPRELETICLRCLQKEPYRRYPGAAAVAADLRRFLAAETDDPEAGPRPP